MANNTNDTVVLLHGLMGSRIDMWPIARRLQKLGYRTLNWRYRSVGKKIETHAQQLGERLAELDQAAEHRFHLVTHSMGGIIIRAILEKWTFQNLHRIVMLAPPHGGSHIARKLAPLFNWMTPSLSQLSDKPGSYVNGLSNSFLDNQIEFGLIEASRDRVVAPGKAIIAGYKDLVSVDGHHAVMTWYPLTQKLVEQFIADGNFALGSDATRVSNDSNLSNKNAKAM